MDIAPLGKDFGAFTYDPGYGLTAATESKITYIDGDAGVLLYRRPTPVEQLAEKSSFVEVCYLLLHGDLPTKPQLESFTRSIQQHTMINESLLRFYNGFHHNAHPMAMVSAVVASMSAFYHDTMDIYNPRHARSSPTASSPSCPPSRPLRTSIRSASRSSIRATTWITARTCCTCSSRCPARPTRSTRWQRRRWTCCSSCMRTTSRTPARPRCASRAARAPFPTPRFPRGVSALWGPAHGGANEAVLSMLEQIGTADNIPKYLAMAKDKSSHFRLMGFGHRVYKNFDPRAKIIRAACHKVLQKLGMTDNPLFELALRLEEVALKDDYFVSRKLYPNVDFYSGVIYSALNIPRSMFTVMFAVARTVGWVAHWQEMISDPAMRIGRPRQLYTGPTRRDYAELGDR